MASIEFRPAASFTSPVFSVQKSSRRAARDGAVTATASLFVPQRCVLFVGLSDGSIASWETDRHALERRGEGRSKVLEGHKGAVKCMVFAEALCGGVMLTGAADRCVKMWDLSEPRSAVCVQTLHGHGGTVLALASAPDLLLSSATDGFLFVWRDTSPAKLLRFPAYTVRQKLTPDVKAGGSRGPKELWFLSLAVRDGEPFSIFAGDSEGFLHVYKPDVADGGELLEPVWRVRAHDLGISRILTVAMEPFVFTLSFDQKFKALDGLTGQALFEESNQCGAVFGAMAWDPKNQDVIVADEKGNVGIYNLYAEACVAWRSVASEPILQASYEAASRRLLLLSPHVLRVLDVVRGVKFAELAEHTGPVVALAPRRAPPGAFLYSASADNTVRLWDVDSMECVKCLREKRSEITAMAFLPRANAIVTGHENSELKLWSVDSQEEALLKMVSGQAVHENSISALATAALGAEDVQKSSLAISGEGWDSGMEVLIAGSYDRQLSFWKVTVASDGTATAKFDRAYLAHEEPGDEILALAYSPAAGSVFTGGNAGVVRKWDLLGPTRLEAEYEGHEDAVHCFAVDGHFLFSGSSDGTVCIWETAQGYELKVVHIHQVQALLVIAESGHVASCGSDGKVVVWAPKIGKEDITEVQSFEQQEDFRALAYSDAARTLLAGCDSGKIVAFPLPADGGAVGSQASMLPRALQGVETPPSTAAGERSRAHRTLEALRLG